MKRSSSSRTRVATAGESSAVGLGIALPTPSPGRSPLRRRRSQTDSDFNDDGSSRATSLGPALGSSRAGSEKASAAGLAAAAQQAPETNGSAQPPPVKRGRGRPRKHPLPEAVLAARAAAAAAGSGTGSTASAASTATPSSTPKLVTEKEKSSAPRSSNGRASASRNARASAAAELNRKAMAASRTDAAAGGADVEMTEAADSKDEADAKAAEEANGDSQADARTGEDGEADDEAAQQEAEEMASRWTEEYYEIVEQLPLELTRCFTLMRETEGKVQNRVERIRKASQSYHKARRDMQVWVNHYAKKGAARQAEAASSSGSSSQAPTLPTSAEPLHSPSRSLKGKEKAIDTPSAAFAQNSSAAQATTAAGADLSTAGKAPGDGANQSPSSKLGSSPVMPMGLRHRLALLTSISTAAYEAKRAADEKVELARTAYELVDRLVLRLDSDLARNEVGLALGLRKGTEESRGAREAQGALTLAQGDAVGSAPVIAHGGTSSDAHAHSAPMDARSASARGSETARSARQGSDAPANKEEATRARAGLARRTSAMGATTGKRDRGQSASVFSPPSHANVLSGNGSESQAGPSGRKDRGGSGSGASRSSSTRRSPTEAGQSSGSKPSQRVSASRSGDGASSEGGKGTSGAQRSNSKAGKRRGDKGKNKSPLLGAGGNGNNEKGSKNGTGQSGRKNSANSSAGAAAATAASQARENDDDEADEEHDDEDEGGDEDAEGEDDIDYPPIDMPIDPNEPRYCYCNDVSRGKMIACDKGDDCPLQWFHFECVGLSEKPNGSWFCLFCKPNFKGQGRNVPPNAVHHPSQPFRPTLAAMGHSAGGGGRGRAG